MTPKEKAKELLDEFKNPITVYPKEENIYYKECALIAVEQVKRVVPSVYLTDDEEIHSGHYQYWQEVKQEIEKL